MDIQVIQNNRYLPVELTEKDVVLEQQELQSEYGFSYLRYYRYNLSDNRREEIFPGLKKIDLCKIKLASSSDYFYFVALLTEIPSLYRCDKQFRAAESICELPAELLDDPSVRMKIFVLNDDHILFQREYAKSNLSQTYETFCMFELSLYSLKEDKHYNVVDINLTTNGIEDLVPLNDTMCVLKTGYNLLEDDRYHKLEKIQTSVESICTVNIMQLISDIRVNQTNILFDFQEQAFYSTTIPYVRKESDYLIYSVINNETNEETISFYHLPDKRMMNCINKNVRTPEQLATAHVVAGIPVVCIKRGNGTTFYNLEQPNQEFVLGAEEELVMLSGGIFATKEIQKGFLWKKPSLLYRFYQYPKGQVVYTHKATDGHELSAILTRNEHYYIFIS